MLVLSRKEDEHLVLINNETKEVITISNVEMFRRKVRLGIQAPPGWKILRHEHLSEQDKQAILPFFTKSKD